MKLRAGRVRIIVVFVMLMALFQVYGQTNDYYVNPVLPSGADPWIVKREGWYYYCCTMPGGIGVSRSKYLHKINPTSLVWKSPERGQWNSACIWAPELHWWKGKWYIFYAGGYGGPPFIHQKTGVLQSVTSDALGEYVDKGMLFTGDVPGDWTTNKWAIDMTMLEYRGELYAIWSGWEKQELTDKTKQHLYIAHMDNPWTMSSKRVCISSPEMEYEQGELPLNEGPQILQNGDDLFIVYSCGQSWLSTYKLAYLKLKDASIDLLNPLSWMKGEKPLFEGTKNVYGVGHASFTTSPDDREHYLVFHTKKNREPGWKREVWLQKFTFDSQGLPFLGKPVKRGKKMKLPSGTGE